VKTMDGDSHQLPKDKPSHLAIRKKERKETWVYIQQKLRVYVFCLVGVIAHRALDIAGESINLDLLSVGYIAFSLVMSILLTSWLEKREIPVKLSRKKAIEILRRMGFNAFMLGFNFQEIAVEAGGKLFG
jgi:hypothetical protein